MAESQIISHHKPYWWYRFII